MVGGLDRLGQGASAPAGLPAQIEGTLLFAEQRTAGPTIGVIGLGTIGSGIATNVHAAGLPLVVYDIRVEATAVTATTPRWPFRQSISLTSPTSSWWP